MDYNMQTDHGPSGEYGIPMEYDTGTVNAMRGIPRCLDQGRKGLSEKVDTLINKIGFTDSISAVDLRNHSKDLLLGTGRGFFNVRNIENAAALLPVTDRTDVRTILHDFGKPIKAVLEII